MANKKERVTEEKEYGIEQLTPPESVDYFTYRLETGRHLKAARSWMIAAIIVFVAFVLANVGWIIYEAHFEDIVVTQENADGYNNYIGNDGDIYNGEADNQNPPS